MFQHFCFDTLANFEDRDFSEPQNVKTSKLPTTTHNSPGSLKQSSPASIELDFNPDISFELGTQITHAQSIWDASLVFLNSSLKSHNEEEKGFNSNEIYGDYFASQMVEEKSLEDAIRNNRLLRSKERNIFIEDLQKTAEICSLLKELKILFSEKVFNQLVYVIQNIWDRHYLLYRESKRQIETCSIIPKFKEFVDFEDREKTLERPEMYYETDVSQIKEASRKDIENLANELFSSKRLKYITLHEIKGEKLDKKIIREQFRIFVRAISNSVFLSAEGVYEEQFTIPMFSEEEDGEELQNGLLNGENSRIVQSFSQIQEKEQFECYAPILTKRRKLI